MLLISIDGLSPDSLFRQGPDIPVLRGLMRQGSYAERVINVNPTVTNPNHTSLITGVSPAVHGIVNNRPFAATAELPPSFRAFAAIKAQTLWGAAKAKGLRTASLYWPVTKDASPIDINIDTGDSHDDEQITRDAIEIITMHRPHLLTVHYVTYDAAQHANGPGTPEAFAALRRIDSDIGRIVARFRAVHRNGVIAIVSDHGFDRTTRAVNLNAAFADAGFIRFTDESRNVVQSWRAFAWYVGASAMVVLNDPADSGLEADVATFLTTLARRADSGIAAIHGPKDIAAAGLSPQARFVIALKPGYRMGNAMHGAYSVPYSGGSHGAYATAAIRRDMHASLILVGEGIAANRNLGTIDIWQIAPTLAGLLNVPLPAAPLKALKLPD